ncbi:MAG: RHS repeat domain-containing protein [Myxococcaceae bacterium]
MALATRLVLVAVCLASVPAIAVVAKSAPLGADNTAETRVGGFGPEKQARTGARAHPSAEAHWRICSKAPRCAAGALVQVKHAKTNHDFGYLYGGKAPHQATGIGDTVLTYDGSGNTLTEVDGLGAGPKRRRYGWTEESWLKEVVEGGDVTSFLYDGSGERVAKRGKYGETVYVGQFYTVRNGTRATKHVFAGTTRLASKLDGAPSSTLVAGRPGGPTHLTGLARACEVGEGWKVGLIQRCPGSPASGSSGEVRGTGRAETYWYLSDHLGSSSYLTDEKGEVFEHVEYFPYGEVWREDGPRKPVSDYRFTAKPLDPETGLTYFGARYYDSNRARWVSPDPALPDYVDQATRGSGPLSGHLFSPVSLSPFAYGSHSPIVLRDPDGKWVPLAFVVVVVILLTLEHDDPGGSEIAQGAAMGMACGAVPTCAAGAGGFLIGKGGAHLDNSLEAYAAGDESRAISEADNARDSFAGGALFLAGAREPAPRAAARELPPLRQQYIDAVKSLGDKAAAMRQAGVSPEQIARTLHAERNALKVAYRGLSPPEAVKAFELRNIKKYGNPLGPTVEQLRAAGKSWEEIAASAARPGGADLGF